MEDVFDIVLEAEVVGYVDILSWFKEANVLGNDTIAGIGAILCSK
jgi:hypothetical protein